MIQYNKLCLFFYMPKRGKISKKVYVLQIIRKYHVDNNTNKTKLSLISRVPFYIKNDFNGSIGFLMILTIANSVFPLYRKEPQ